MFSQDIPISPTHTEVKKDCSPTVYWGQDQTLLAFQKFHAMDIQEVLEALNQHPVRHHILEYRLTASTRVDEKKIQSIFSKLDKTPFTKILLAELRRCWLTLDNERSKEAETIMDDWARQKNENLTPEVLFYKKLSSAASQDELYNLAMEYMEKNQLDQAEEYFEKSAQLGHHFALQRLALDAFKQKNLAKTFAYLRAVAELPPPLCHKFIFGIIHNEEFQNSRQKILDNPNLDWEAFYHICIGNTFGKDKEFKSLNNHTMKDIFTEFEDDGYIGYLESIKKLIPKFTEMAINHAELFDKLVAHDGWDKVKHLIKEDKKELIQNRIQRKIHTVSNNNSTIMSEMEKIFGLNIINKELDSILSHENVKTLLVHNEDPNQYSTYKKTPLLKLIEIRFFLEKIGVFFYYQKDFYNMLNRLLAYGANFNLPDLCGYNAKQKVVEYKYNDAEKLFDECIRQQLPKKFFQVETIESKLENNELTTLLKSKEKEEIKFSLSENKDLSDDQVHQIYVSYKRFFEPSSVIIKHPSGNHLEEFFKHEIQAEEGKKKFIERIFHKNKLVGVNFYEIIPNHFSNIIIFHLSGTSAEKEIRGRGIIDPLVFSLAYAVQKLFPKKIVVFVYQSISYGSANFVIKDLLCSPKYQSKIMDEIERQVITLVQRNFEDPNQPMKIIDHWTEIEVQVVKEQGETKTASTQTPSKWLFNDMRGNPAEGTGEHRGVLFMFPLGKQSFEKHAKSAAGMGLDYDKYTTSLAERVKLLLFDLNPSNPSEFSFYNPQRFFFHGKFEKDENPQPQNHSVKC